MAHPRAPVAPDFTRRVSVETPEHVVLRLELAGPGSRLVAGVYDLVVIVALMALIGMVASVTGLLGRGAASWVTAMLLVAGFLALWGYFTLFEALAGGRTPGKRRVGIRVVMDTGHPITFQAAVARNLLRIVDAQPALTYGVGLAFVILRRDHRRLGDLVAGTLVVRDRPEELHFGAAIPVETAALELGTPVLTDDEFRLLGQFIARLEDLGEPVRARLTAELAHRFRDRIATTALSAEMALVELHADELARRRGKTAARRTAGGSTTGGTAERFVAIRAPSWERFRGLALALERDGLRGLAGADVTAFAREYREVAADLARARTYGADARVLAYLERIVGAGHNALYGLRGVRRLPLSRLLLRDLPTAAYRARWLVVVAAALFVVPGGVGYLLVRDRPAVVHEILPDRMIARAEAGAAQRTGGRGYAETPSPFLPLVATSIIANNVQVAFGAFALGITAGIGTIVVLVFNGLFFGTVLGMFANYHLAGWILTFVAGHGVLELTAIFVAAAAGLLVARAIVAPGDLARRDALVVYGRWAVELVGVSACLLVLAGLVEGFLSASDAPAGFKFAASGASAVLVALLFAAGRASERRIPETEA